MARFTVLSDEVTRRPSGRFSTDVYDHTDQRRKHCVIPFWLVWKIAKFVKGTRVKAPFEVRTNGYEVECHL